jgi:uncharacterized membrane protein YcjF (UPF0283 family)
LSIINILVAAISPIAMVFLSRIVYSECWGTRLVRRLSTTHVQEQETEEQENILPR